MSKANGATLKQDIYLQHVSLKNYKSIKDLEIDFKPGLNIIIGKNSSGKTNFINGLNEILNLEDKPFSDSESKINAKFESDIVEIETLNQNQKTLNPSDDYYGLPLSQSVFLKINNASRKVNGYKDLKGYLFGHHFNFNKCLIEYGIHYNDKARFINVPFSFVIIYNGRVSRDLMMVTTDNNATQFILGFFNRLYLNINYGYQNAEIDDTSIEELRKKIIWFSEIDFKHINSLIYNFSPIKNIRVNQDFNIVKEESSKLTITNFYLEFQIDQNWLTFNLLSDGTKRLFYIISEILSLDPPSLIKNDDLLNIILLEEPELGIHPHQLHQLMQFIKEQSREKQIILTTHSPQVLDILEPGELDRVIICHYDSQKGTQLSHLSDKEIKKAKKYMQEEAFLSDYWRFSDLEPAS